MNHKLLSVLSVCIILQHDHCSPPLPVQEKNIRCNGAKVYEYKYIISTISRVIAESCPKH